MWKDGLLLDECHGRAKESPFLQILAPRGLSFAEFLTPSASVVEEVCGGR